MHFTVVKLTTNAVNIAVNAANNAYLNGTLIGTGDSIDSGSTAGEVVTFTYVESGYWSALSDTNWADANP